MAAGLGLLRLSPAAFWSMTPRELAAALRGLLGPANTDAPLPRAALAQLMSRFPDRRRRETVVKSARPVAIDFDDCHATDTTLTH